MPEGCLPAWVARDLHDILEGFHVSDSFFEEEPPREDQKTTTE